MKFVGLIWIITGAFIAWNGSHDLRTMVGVCAALLIGNLWMIAAEFKR